MKPKNFETFSMTSWIGIYLGGCGVVLGLVNMGMPTWVGVTGIGLFGGVAALIGCRQISELFRDSQ